MTSSTSSSEVEHDRGSTFPTRVEGRFYANVDHADVWLPEGPDLPGDPIRRDPAALILLVLLVLSVVIVVFRFDSRPAAAPDWFFMQKIEWRGEAGTVIAGDSRVYRGVAPGQMEEVLPSPIRNLGFSSAKYSDEYLSYIRSVIDDDLDRRVIILAITPFSFTGRQAGFEDSLAKNRSRRVPLWLLRAIDLDHAFMAIDPSLIVPMHGVVKKERASAGSYKQVFHHDGWVESDYRVEDPDAKWRAGLPDLAAAYATDPERIERLVNAVESWTAQGIFVAAFCPPIPEESYRLEAALWGIDYERLSADIESVGGVWLETPCDASYRIYDGSHLDGESALRFSRELGRQIISRIDER